MDGIGLSPVGLLFVVADGSADGCSRPYIRNHPSACLVRSLISMLNAFNSRVCCSNAAIWRGIETLEKWLLMARHLIIVVPDALELEVKVVETCQKLDL